MVCIHAIHAQPYPNNRNDSTHTQKPRKAGGITACFFTRRVIFSHVLLLLCALHLADVQPTSTSRPTNPLLFSTRFLSLLFSPSVIPITHTHYQSAGSLLFTHHHSPLLGASLILPKQDIHQRSRLAYYPATQPSGYSEPSSCDPRLKQHFTLLHYQPLQLFYTPIPGFRVLEVSFRLESGCAIFFCLRPVACHHPGDQLDRSHARGHGEPHLKPTAIIPIGLITLWPFVPFFPSRNRRHRFLTQVCSDSWVNPPLS